MSVKKGTTSALGGGISAGVEVGIDDREWQRLRALGIDDFHVRVGVLAGDDQHDDARQGADGGEGEGIGMLELAAIQQYGSEEAGIPARPWIDAPFKAHPERLAETCGKLAHAMLQQRMDVQRAYALLGAWSKREIQMFVTSGPHIPPPLAPATKSAKGSDRPLVDTGRMVGAVDYQVAQGSARA